MAVLGGDSGAREPGRGLVVGLSFDLDADALKEAMIERYHTPVSTFRQASGLSLSMKLLE